MEGGITTNTTSMSVSHPMSIPQLNVNPGEVTFCLQSGLLKDTVSIDASELNLKSLKDLACNFFDRKVRMTSIIRFIHCCRRS